MHTAADRLTEMLTRPKLTAVRDQLEIVIEPPRQEHEPDRRRIHREDDPRRQALGLSGHVAGDKVFVDYSGKWIAIVDPGTGVVHDAEIFVGVLGASSYTYAEATFTQTLPDWIGAHVRMLRFFGGVPRLAVPDNLKSGVHKASFYDPEINRSYGMMAAHYGIGVLPTRPRKPRDKANSCRTARTGETLPAISAIHLWRLSRTVESGKPCSIVAPKPS
jgi:transposase